MEFTNAAILITENCNARCKMCCDSRGLVRGKTISNNELEHILVNIKNAECIKHVGITGGEPLLYPNIVDRILTFDFGRPVTITIKSNGFWGRDIKKAEDFVKCYGDRLSTISLSYDEFHKEFIDVQCIKNIIMICKKYNVKSEVVGCFLKEGLTHGDILNELGESAYITRFLYQPVIQTGSGALFKETSYVKIIETDNDNIRCIATLSPNVLINPKLDVFPCCSQVIENTILSVGNLKDSSLNDIILKIKQNYVFNTLFIHGFAPYIEILKKYHFNYPKQLASPCELCEFIFRNDDFLQLLHEIKYYEDI